MRATFAQRLYDLVTLLSSQSCLELRQLSWGMLDNEAQNPDRANMLMNQSTLACHEKLPKLAF